MTLYDRQQSRQAMKAITALFRQPCLEQQSKQHFSPMGRPVIAAGITTRESQADSPKNPLESK